MDPIRNPFTPGAGAPPPELTGRDALLQRADLLFARVLNGRYEKSMLLVGLRGVGKTVLLNAMQRLAEQRGYEAVAIEAREATPLAELLAPPLRRLLYAFDRMGGFSRKAREALFALKGFLSGLKVRVAEIEIGVDAGMARGIADSGDLESDLPELFEAVAEAALDRKRGVALFIDELQYLNEKELGALIMAMHRMAQRKLPLVIVGAGLPQLPGPAGDAKSYAERLFDYPPVGALDPADAARALQDPVREEGAAFTDDALAEIHRVTHGYPYYLQEWGSHAWNLAERSPIGIGLVRQASARATAALDNSFFRVRFDRLTPREKEYLRALAELGPPPQRSGDIARALGKSVNAVGPLRDGLIRKGMLYSPAHGDTAFTVPLFDEFMKREMPDWRPAGEEEKAKRK